MIHTSYVAVKRILQLIFMRVVVAMTRISGPYGVGNTPQHAMFGLTEHGEGKIAIYGDSNCLDSSHQRSNCFSLLQKTLAYLTEVGCTFS